MAALDFFAGYLADVADEAVDELDVGHLQREDGDGGVVVDGHILCHGEDEGGLAHGGACGDDDEVAALPAGGDAVEFDIAGGDAGDIRCGAKCCTPFGSSGAGE